MNSLEAAVKIAAMSYFSFSEIIARRDSKREIYSVQIENQLDSSDVRLFELVKI